MKQWLLAATVLFAPQKALASPFANLDFESADTNKTSQIVPGSPRLGGLGTTADLLPHWHIFANSTELSRVAFNAGSVLVPEPVVLFTKFAGVGGDHLWDGNFALRLFSSQESGIPVPTYSLTQSGDVPSDARLLMFTGRVSAGFSVLIGGVEPDLVAGSKSTPQPNLMAYDISAYAGRNVELRFELRSLDPQNGDYMYLDSIHFSPIPEPGVVALFTLGGAFLLAWPRGDRAILNRTPKP